MLTLESGGVATYCFNSGCAFGRVMRVRSGTTFAYMSEPSLTTSPRFSQSTAMSISGIHLHHVNHLNHGHHNHAHRHLHSVHLHTHATTRMELHVTSSGHIHTVAVAGASTGLLVNVLA